MDELEVGSALVRSAWGRGYATEAASPVRDLALTRLGRRRPIALVRPANERSAAVARKLGMRHEKDVVFRERPHRLFATTASVDG